MQKQYHTLSGMQQQFKHQQLAEYEVYTSKNVFVNCVIESLV